jgi:hypothetical protein
MRQLTVDLAEADALNLTEIAKLQSEDANKVANRAMALGMQILKWRDLHGAQNIAADTLLLESEKARQLIDETMKTLAALEKKQKIMTGFGMWANLETTPKDGLGFQQAERAEWR